MALFEKKNFNGQVFGRYVDRIPNTIKNQLIKSGAIRMRPDLAASMKEGTGGNYISTPLLGLVNGEPVNYDGLTDIPADDTDTYMHDRVVVGRAKAWREKDFAEDITGGVSFMANIAQQVADYWNWVDQRTLIQILKGVFSMSDTAGAEFVATHTTDVTGNAASGDVGAGCISATTMNSAVQKACGDNKGIFSLALMHSSVSTNLENLKLVAYVKQVDANGMERELTLMSLNGKAVLVDDTMPTNTIYTAAGTYRVTIGGTVASGDKITVLGTEVTLDSTSGASATAAASAVATALGTNAKYTITASEGVITFVEKLGSYGAGAPAAAITSTEGTINVTTVTTPASTTAYTTYVLGLGAIELTNCGAKVPYEMDRDPKTAGGQDLLYSRQRKCFAPYGISFTKNAMARMSPTNVELANGSNWELVNTGGSTKQYIDHKNIPIAQIISRG